MLTTGDGRYNLRPTVNSSLKDFCCAGGGPLATGDATLRIGGFGIEVGSDHCASSEKSVGCRTVEESGFKPMGNGISVPSPDLFVCLWLICVPSIPAFSPDDASVMPDNFIEHPKRLGADLQFVHRAALSPRAPTLSLA